MFRHFFRVSFILDGPWVSHLADDLSGIELTGLLAALAAPLLAGGFITVLRVAVWESVKK